MTTTQQAEFLSSIMEELEADPKTTQEDKQLLKSAQEYLRPLLEPPKLYAGYEHGLYYIRLNFNTKLTTIASLQTQGYQLHFLEPPFGKPIMLKKRD
jgi:hypothetical protein